MSFLMIIPIFGISQETHLKILDNINKEPIAFANVIVSKINSTDALGYVSDEDGFVSFNIEQKSIFQLTYVGYQDITDTIFPGESKTVYLKSISYNVDEVVVTGQYVASRQDKSIYKVKVLNSREIEQRAAVNIKEMLSTELNIRTTHDNSLGSSLTMQGLGGEHIKFLVDGVPVIGRENGNIDLDQINLQNIDHVEVINGPMSVVYGSNALAGVINIITKSPDRLLYSSYFDTYYESVGVFNINAGASMKHKRNSFSVNGGRNYFDGFSTVDIGRWQQWKPKEQWNFSTEYKYTWNKAFVKFAANYFNQELRDKGILLPPYYETAFDKFFYTRRIVLRSDFKYEFSKKSRIKATASYSYYSKIKNTYLNDLTILEMNLSPGQQDTTLFNNIMFRSDYSFGTESSLLRFQTGIDLNSETGEGKRIKDEQQQIGDYAAFLSLNYSPINVLNIQPGIRVIYNTKFNAPVIYSLNVKYDASERFIVRASIASGFRAPSLKELYLEFIDVNHDVRGNENLIAETSINTNMLLQYNSTSERAYVWGLELNLFNNNIKDNIQLIPLTGSSNIYTYVNVNSFISQGAELNFNNNIYPHLTLKFGVSLIGQKINFSGSESGDFDYYSDFNTSLNYWWRKYDLNFSLYYKYNGKYPQLYFVGVDQEPETRLMDAYQTLDINVSKWFFKRRMNIQVGGKNLFNNTNIDVSGSQGGGVHSVSGGSVPLNWGRTFFVKFQLRINK